MKVPDLDYQAEVRKCKTMEDVVGKNGLMQKLFKDIIQQLLEAEMEEHLGRERHEREEIMKLKTIGMDIVLRLLKVVLVKWPRYTKR